MLCRPKVLTEHILYRSLSTSLTLTSASLTPKGDADAVESEVSCAGEAELYHGMDGGWHQRDGVVQDLWDLTDAGYTYIRRYLKDGLKGLEELSRAPQRVWNRTPACVEKLIVDIRKHHPRYGALTIHLLMRRAIDRKAIPAVSTIDLILKRHGLVKKRRRVRRIRETHTIFVAQRPNVIWSADFKGKFRTGDMRYCYPLTIMDSYSRYVLAIVGMYKPTFEATKAAFEALFEEFGLPDQIHTDNGEPFASTVSLSRLTRLAVWFMDLGIVPVYSDPGHPSRILSMRECTRI